MKMPQELFDKWLAALRSGDIPQGKGALHCTESGSMCCLGVLCHVSGIQPEYNDTFCVVYDGEDAGLSSRLVEDWGFYDGFGAFSYGVSNLATMNDNGQTFSEIADFIENNRDRVLK